MAEFSVRLTRPVTSAGSGAPVGQWRFDGDRVLFRFSSELPGGFGRCQVGGEASQLGEIVPLFIPKLDVDLGPFDHVEISTGTTILWEGRVVEPQLDGWGEPVGFVADGYWSMLNDGHYAAPAGEPGLATSGAILKHVTQQLAPALRIGGPDQFIDPAIPSDPEELDGVKGGAVWDHVAKVGDPLGRRVDPMVWDNRTVWLQSRAAPQRPHYVIDLGENLDITSNWNELYGRVAVKGTHPEEGEFMTDFAEDPLFLARYGFHRTNVLEGGSLTFEVAEAIRDTFFEQHRRIQYSISFSLDNDEGLRQPNGAVVPPWLVRAGQWIEVADLGQFIIIRSEYDSGAQSLSIQLNNETHDWEQQLAMMQHVVAAINAKLNPQTGGRA